MSLAIADLNPPKSHQFWHSVLRRLFRDKLTLLALGVLTTLTIACLAGPPLVENLLKVDPNRTRVTDRYLPPTPDHPLGTDNLGRDQLIRLLYGGRISLAIPFIVKIMWVSICLSVG